MLQVEGFRIFRSRWFGNNTFRLQCHSNQTSIFKFLHFETRCFVRQRIHQRHIRKMNRTLSGDQLTSVFWSRVLNSNIHLQTSYSHFVQFFDHLFDVTSFAFIVPTHYLYVVSHIQIPSLQRKYPRCSVSWSVSSAKPWGTDLSKPRSSRSSQRSCFAHSVALVIPFKLHHPRSPWVPYLVR